LAERALTLAPPAPRRRPVIARPKTYALVPRLRLSIPVVAVGVAGVVGCPSSLDHAVSDILAIIAPALGHVVRPEPAALYLLNPAGDDLAFQALAQCLRCLGGRLPFFTIAKAPAPALGSVDAPNPRAIGGKIERPAIDHCRGPRDQIAFATAFSACRTHRPKGQQNTAERRAERNKTPSSHGSPCYRPQRSGSRARP